MLEYVRQRMNHSIIKLADSRLNIDAFPERALFEGIINAITGIMRWTARRFS